jgi:hypothetical protein
VFEVTEGAAALRLIEKDNAEHARKHSFNNLATAVFIM